MSDFEEVAPPDYVPLEINGKEWRFGVLRLSDHIQAAQEMKKEWKSPHEALLGLCRDTDEDTRNQITKLAYYDERRGGQASLDDVLEWYETPRGKLYNWWMKLRKHHSEVTEDEVDKLIGSIDEALRQARGITDGVPLGNGQPPSERAANESQSVGVASSEP